jgi:hypothetical protein
LPRTAGAGWQTDVTKPLIVRGFFDFEAHRLAGSGMTLAWMDFRLGVERDAGDDQPF